MNVGDYYTNGQWVVHIQERTASGDWIVLVWDSATAQSRRHLIQPNGKTLTMSAKYRLLTPAEVRQWVAGGPVPGREGP